MAHDDDQFATTMGRTHSQGGTSAIHADHGEGLATIAGERSTDSETSMISSTSRRRAGTPAIAGILLAIGAATTYGTSPAAALYALPAAVAVAIATALMPRARSHIVDGRQTYSAYDALAYVTMGIIAGGASFFAMFLTPALTPRVDLTMRQYRDLQMDLSTDRRLAPLLATAAADGRIDLRELATYHRAVRATGDRQTIRDVIGAARTTRTD